MRNIARNVVPRVVAVELVPEISQIETRLATFSASQTVLHGTSRRESPDQVPTHVMDALEKDMNRVEQVPCSPRPNLRRLFRFRDSVVRCRVGGPIHNTSVFGEVAARERSIDNVGTVKIRTRDSGGRGAIANHTVGHRH